ncbi:polyprenyl diphosphate synthase [Marinicella sp. W31]|uniref:polyprenyl diphosphate synthase n=1 Tax=Marinicella sp. W31 TaxID=3023713 RepID=UPI003756FE1A
MSLRHVAIIMDGNGRWAARRKRPRTFGHQRGARAVKKTIEACIRNDVAYLTLFAFSSENWSRPEQEVQKLMQLFMRSLKKETPELQKQGVQLAFIGDLSRFSEALQESMRKASEPINTEQRLILNIAVNYGGQWDISQACRKLAQEAKDGLIQPESIDEELFQSYTSLHPQPVVDLMIRTGGEHRISNFLLWQIAYSELYFTETLWPDFDMPEFNEIVNAFNRRERRFGQTSEQINA